MESVIGFFPAFGNNHLGGIQESARVAWPAVQRAARAEVVCYDNGNDDSARLSKIRTIVDAIRSRSEPRLVLVWQLGLLKLVPFARTGEANLVVFLHGIEAWKKPDLLTQKLLRGVNLFLANSKYTWQQFISYNPSLHSSAHAIVPLGILEPVTSESLPDSPPVALVISRLFKREDYKGHREMISVWPEVRRKSPLAELWIAGEGDLRPELERLAREIGVQDQVKFWGRISEGQKLKLINRCRCLAMPSRSEGFGLVYLEAMRSGRPCLISTLDAGREVVNPPEAGLSVDPKDSDDLANGLVRLLAEGDEWNRLSKQARLRYEQNYTASHFQRRLIDALFSGSDVEVLARLNNRASV